MFSLERDENEVPALLATVKSALDTSSQYWDSIGLQGVSSAAVSTRDLNGVRDRVFSILIIRLMAIVHQKIKEKTADKVTQENEVSPNEDAPIRKISDFKFADYSTTTICQTILALSNNEPNELVWPEEISPDVIQNILDYTLFILKTYRRVPYHNAGHAYHVICSSNKLLDMLLCDYDLIKDFQPYQESNATAFELKKKELQMNDNNVFISSGDLTVARFKQKSDVSSSFGIKKDTLIQFAFLFSALVHDVDHTGVSNGQLVLESDELAILYNDQSVLEQRSLAIAFSELRKPEYQPLRDILFMGGQEEYVRFRRTVIDLVLCTDIGSPERVQIVKSKWKEAFGDTDEAKKRKAKKEMKLLQKRFDDLGVDPKVLRHSMPLVTGQNLNAQYRRQSKVTKKDHNESDSGSANESPTAEGPTLTRKFLRERASMQFSSVMNNSENNSFKCSDSQTSYFTSSSESDFDTDSDFEDVFDEHFQDALTSTSISTSDDNVNGKVNNIGEKPYRTVIEGKRVSIGHNVKFAVSNSGQRRGSELSIRSITSKSSNKSKGSKGSKSSRSSRRLSGPENIDTGKKRRFTAPAIINKKNRQYRLGIRRALDLTGRTIDYSLTQNGAVASIYSPNLDNEDDDECDDMKKIVVLEQMLMAADVSANMQGWENMLKWNTRLFNEQKASFDSGRGVDPTCGWYDGQITFFNCYTLLLARRLAETGVFGDDGDLFATNVERNRDLWIKDGVAATSQMIYEWGQKQRRRRSSFKSR